MVISAFFVECRIPLIKRVNSNLFLDKFIAAYRRRIRIAVDIVHFGIYSCHWRYTHPFHRYPPRCPASNSFVLALCRLSHAHILFGVFCFVFPTVEFMAKDTEAKPESSYSTHIL